MGARNSSSAWSSRGPARSVSGFSSRETVWSTPRTSTSPSRIWNRFIRLSGENRGPDAHGAIANILSVLSCLTCRSRDTGGAVLPCTDGRLVLHAHSIRDSRGGRRRSTACHDLARDGHRDRLESPGAIPERPRTKTGLQTGARWHLHTFCGMHRTVVEILPECRRPWSVLVPFGPFRPKTAH